MNNGYDVIVVGAGNGGLVSACSLVNKGYKVLLLDEHNNIGGSSWEIIKGRFHFGSSIHNLYLNNMKYKYTLKNIMKECSMDDEIEYSVIDNICKIVTPDKEIVLPFGIENYIRKIEEEIPNSEESLREFIKLATECRDALEYITLNHDNLDFDCIKNKYNNFMKIATYSLSKVLDSIDMPIETQEILSSLWMLLGSSISDISFVTYAIFLLNIIEYGIVVPKNSNYDVALTFANNFLVKGGELRLNSKVVNLIVENGKIKGCKLNDDTCLYADRVIVNASISNVYGTLIPQEQVPIKALKNIASRELGGRLFTIHLGLNRSASELGLDNYMYFLYSSLDSDFEQKRMTEVANGNQIVIVHNNANRSISPEGTCSISISTIYFGDCFGEYVKNDKYYTDVEGIVGKIINVFQNYTNIIIKDYIEEIEVISPVSVAGFNGSPDGCTFGYKLAGLDDMLPRILNCKNENYVDGLYLCGGFDGDVYNYLSSYVSGIESACEAMKYNKKGDR